MGEQRLSSGKTGNWSAYLRSNIYARWWKCSWHRSRSDRTSNSREIHRTGWLLLLLRSSFCFCFEVFFSIFLLLSLSLQSHLGLLIFRCFIKLIFSDIELVYRFYSFIKLKTYCHIVMIGVGRILMYFRFVACSLLTVRQSVFGYQNKACHIFTIRPLKCGQGMKTSQVLWARFGFYI